MALRRVWMPSPCYHGRNTNGVRLIVLHTAEGARTIESLGNFFANYNNQVSSHVGADDQPGKIGEYVTRGNAAWTQANYNNAAVALELCGFASWTTSEWKNNHHNMLENAAAWIAEESKKFNIPITALNNSQSQGNGRGVTQHINLGPGGSGHVDCGHGFPMSYVINLAKGGAPTNISVSSEKEDKVMQLEFDSGNTEISELPACSISIPNEFSTGKHKLRFSCRRPTALRVLFQSGRTDIQVEEFDALSVNIPDGERVAIVKRENGSGPVSVVFSER